MIARTIRAEPCRLQSWTKIDDSQEYRFKEYWALSAEPQ